LYKHFVDDDDDMNDLYLSRKLDASSSPTSSSDAPYWFYGSPNTGSKRHKSSIVSDGSLLEKLLWRLAL